MALKTNIISAITPKFLKAPISLFLILMLSNNAYSQAPTYFPTNISVRTYLGKFEVSWRMFYSNFPGDVNPDSFVIILTKNKQIEASCLPVDGDDFYNGFSGTGPFYLSQMQVQNCSHDPGPGNDDRFMVKIKANIPGTIPANIRDTVMILNIDTTNSYSVIIIPAANTTYYNSGITSGNSVSALKPGLLDSIPFSSPSVISFPSISQNSLMLKWRNGSGDSVLILAIENNLDTATFTNPIDGTTYIDSANTNYSSAKKGTGTSRVIYAGKSNGSALFDSLLVTGLNNTKRYHFRIYSFNKDTCYVNYTHYRCPNDRYRVLVVPQRSTRLLPNTPNPSINLIVVSLDTAKMRVRWNKNSSDSSLLVFSLLPITGCPSRTYVGNTNFSSATDTFSTGKVMSVRSDSDITVTGLTHDTRYYIAVYNYNSNGSGLLSYNCTAAKKDTFTDAKRPQFPPTLVSKSSTTINGNPKTFNVTLNWNKGSDASRSLIIASRSPISANPIDLNLYNASSVFGSGHSFGSGQYAVYSGVGTSVTITGIPKIDLDTTLYFKIFSFNGSFSFNQRYLLTNVLTNEIVFPVELIEFTGKFENSKVVLNWTTASETNNLGFEVLKSTDNKKWMKVGFVEGKGNSTTQESYEFDNAINEKDNPTFYFKLKQIDYNGDYKYSKVISVFRKSEINAFVDQDKKELNLYSISDLIKSVDIIGQSGIAVQKINLLYPLSKNYIHTFPIDNLSSGIYYVRLGLMNEYKTFKVVIR